MIFILWKMTNLLIDPCFIFDLTAMSLFTISVEWLKSSPVWRHRIWSFSVCCAVIFTPECSLFFLGGIPDGERVKALSMWHWRQIWLWRPWAGSTSWAHQGLCLQTLHQLRQSCDCDSWHIWVGTPKHEIHSWYANSQWIHVRNPTLCKGSL